MTEFIFEYEGIIRIGSFLGLFALLTIWEIASPRRKLLELRTFRWINNIGLIVLSSVLVRFIFPTAAVGIGLIAEQNQWGILNYIDLPFALQFIIAFILMDFIIYFQHVIFHAIPLFWRFHRVHHSDLDCDVTTGLRFHPFEIVMSILIKFLAIITLGVPVITIVVFEIILNAASMFTHSNIKLPFFEPILRWFIVTPDMHRVHHSVEEDETNSNFGFFISCWDRIFGTYTDKPREGHTEMGIGLSHFREPKWQDIRWLIYLPFVTKIHDYTVNKRNYQENNK